MGAHPELIHVRLPNHVSSGLLQQPNTGCILSGDEALEDSRAGLCRLSSHQNVVLDPDGNAGQWALRTTRRLLYDPDKSIQPSIQLADPPNHPIGPASPLHPTVISPWGKIFGICEVRTRAGCPMGT